MLVLDEADRMLDMGFVDDVERIALLTPKTRQTVLFSATFDGAIARLDRAPDERCGAHRGEERQRGAARHRAARAFRRRPFAQAPASSIICSPMSSMTQSIVFIATKRDAESLAQRLKGEGHAAAALHGDMNQYERTRTLQDMRRGRVRTLVATDVAARGIDVAGISHVINFDLPRQAGDYVHRIGRTGRAGAAGIAVSLANHAERGALRQIERFTGAAISAHVIPGLEPRRREERAAPRTGFAKPAFRGAHAPAHARPPTRWEDRAAASGTGWGGDRDAVKAGTGFRGAATGKSANALS